MVPITRNIITNESIYRCVNLINTDPNDPFCGLTKSDSYFFFLFFSSSYFPIVLHCAKNTRVNSVCFGDFSARNWWEHKFYCTCILYYYTVARFHSRFFVRSGRIVVIVRGVPAASVFFFSNRLNKRQTIYLYRVIVSSDIKMYLLLTSISISCTIIKYRASIMYFDEKPFCYLIF